MEPSNVLAASLALSLTLGVIVVQYGKNRSEVQMPNAKLFVTIRLQEVLPHGRATIIWRDPDRISVTLQLVLHDAAWTFAKTWRVALSESQQLQMLLSGAGQLATQTGVEYILELGQPDQNLTRIAWSPTTETSLLLHIRSELERLSHL
jgi:hypothetical protein